MSSTIRSVLTTAIPRARQNLTAAIDLLANANAGIPALSSASETLSRNSDLIQKQLDKWGTVIQGLDGARKTTEEDLFEQYRAGGDAPGEMIVILQETIGQLDLRTDQIRVRNHPPPALMAPPNQILPIPLPQNFSVPLPPMGLLDFDGNPARWGSFWANFRDNIDRRAELSPAQKLSYLIGQLRGSARDLVTGYPIVDTNYDIVKQALSSRFGDEYKRANDLRAELIRLPKATMTTASLRSLSESVERICRQLNSLEANMDESPYVITTLLEKIPPEARFELLKQEKENSANGAKWSAKQWRDGLVGLVELREAAKVDREPQGPRSNGIGTNHVQGRTNGQRFPISQPRRAFPVIKPSNNPRKDGGNQNPNLSTFPPFGTCSLCENGAHRPTNCPQFPTPFKRRQRLTEQNRCHLCIRSGHDISNCVAISKCSCCGNRHHLVVCPKYQNGTPPIWNKKGTGANKTQLGTKNQSPPGHSAALTVATSVIDSKKGRNPSYLMVIKVNVFNHREPVRPISVPVFLDVGSQNSFITTDLVREINPPKISSEEMLIGGFVGNNKETFSRFISPCFSVMLARDDGGWEQILLNQTNKITSSIECLMDPREISHFLPTETENPTPCLLEPKIMIGVREFWRFILESEEIRPGIFRVKTVFGIIFGGEECGISQPTVVPAYNCPIVRRSVPEESDVAKFWALETIGVSDNPNIDDDEMAMEKFRKTITKNEENRYEVGLPWKIEGSYPPENFRIAFSRLSALVKRLHDSPQMFVGCNEIIQDYLNRGIIEFSSRTNAPQHFLPHHMVIGKRLRIVFDASSHEKSVHSLNDLLYAGPNLYPDLAGKLIQYRMTICPVWADIEKAFLMVGLRKSDREFSKFLWIKDINKPLSGENLVVFRFSRITFGIVSCPFLLAATLQHHLENNVSPLAKEIRQHSLLYVDNLLLLADEPKEAQEKALEAIQIFSEAKMRLRDFIAADQFVLNAIPEGERLPDEEPSVLGLKWKLESDSLSFSFPTVPPPEGLTRRIVLKTVASFFDPLGLCSPCLVGPKLFFQNLWEKSRGWDEPIPDSELSPWRNLRTQWDGQKIVIPRHTPRKKSGNLQLHIFTDASPQVFATAVYLRAEYEGTVSNSLIYARSRLRPKKMGQNQSDGLTIPRLELLGVLIGARAAKFVCSHTPFLIQSTNLWTDSRIVLSWLSTMDKLPIFVANRVREIRSHRHITFRYVRSADNPADLATRVSSPEELKNNNLWWKGPEWLKNSTEFWPNEITAVLPPEESPTPEPIVSASAVAVPIIFEFSRFSSWQKLLRTTFRFMKYLANVGKNKGLFSEMKSAENLGPENQKSVKNWLFKLIQRGMTPPAQTYLDKSGLVRLKSRLSEDAENDFAHPIVIPTGSTVLTLLIRNSHVRLLHTGVDATLTDFLSQFWCEKARRKVRKVITDCNTCKKDRAVTFGLPPMPPLPKSRTNPSSAFENVGIDFLGPTLFKTAEPGPAKAWVLLITCLACRAIHLEIVSSMSAEHFLMAFRRFVARRGRPKTILSDHGTQFVLTKKVIESCTDLDIKWKMIPAFSPWSGGVYERLNTLIKNCFRRVLGRKLLNWEEICTFLTEIEAAINSRPITFVSDEADGPLPLRPIDLLSPKANLSFEETDMSDELYKPSPAEKLAQRWWATTQTIRNFWERWSQEYLLMLRERNQTTHKGPRVISKIRPKPNQIVLVEQEDFPRNTWPMGKIVEVQGPENNPRSANILMPNGRILSRPVSKLVPLEAIPEDTSENVSSPPLPGGFLPENLGKNQENPEKLVENEENLEDEQNSELNRPKNKEKEPVQQPTRKSPRTPKPFSKWDDHPRRPTVSFAALSATKTLNLLMILSLMFGTVCTANIPIFNQLSADALERSNISNFFVCNAKGATITAPPGTQKVETCCDGICGSREYKNPFLFSIPEENLLLGLTCNTKFMASPNVMSHTVQCAPIDVCLLIDCYWCLGRIFNLHCSPIFSALLIGCGALFLSILMFCVCCILSWTRCCFRSLKRCRQCICCPFNRILKKKRYRPIATEIEDLSDHEWPKLERLYNNYRFRPMTKLGMALSILFMVLGFYTINGSPATITANTEECESSSNGTECRFNSVTLINLLPAGQPVELLIRGPESMLLGTITFTLRGLSQECIPESLGFIRSYKIETLANKRCPGMGSCTGKTCESLLPNQTVPELAEGNKYPGNSYCLDSGSFWFNGCGGTNAACLFFRNYAVPTRQGNQFVYEIFRCPAWDFRVKTEVKISFHGNPSQSEEMTLYSGRTFQLRPANLSITPAVFGTPPAPVLSGTFIGGFGKAALVPVLEPTLHCADEVSANLMNCSLALGACAKCRPDHAEGLVRCHCRELDVEQLLEDPGTKLPLAIGPLILNYHNPRGIWVETDYVPIQIALKMKGLRLSILHHMATCKVTPKTLVGCYRCRIGSRFSYTCKASYGTPLAEILCDNGAHWVVPCTAHPILLNTSLSLESADISTMCYVTCPGGETVFRMEGTLSYFPTLSRPLRISGKGTEITTGGFNFPEIGDVWHVLSWIISGYQTFVICSVILVGTLILYIFVKINPVFRGYRLLARLALILFLSIIPQALGHASEEDDDESALESIDFKIRMAFHKYPALWWMVYCLFGIFIVIHIYAIIMIVREWKRRRGLFKHQIFRRDLVLPPNWRIADSRF